MFEETKRRIKPGYVAGDATKEIAMNLSCQLWTAIRQRASEEVKELMCLQSSLDCLLWDVGIEDNQNDPLATIVRALEALDRLKREESPDDNPNP